MHCRPGTRRRTDRLWQLFVGATFVCCVFLIYQFLIFEGIICRHQSECLENTKTISSEKLLQEECRSLCNTTECIKISYKILKDMNQSTNPCKDFYNFACGNYIERNEDGSDHGYVYNLEKELIERVREVLDEETTYLNEKDVTSAIHKLKLVYDSCIDNNRGSSSLEAIKSVLQFLNHVGINNWPFFSSNFTSQLLSEVLGRLWTNGEFTFFKPVIDPLDSQSEGEKQTHNITVKARYFYSIEEENERLLNSILRYLDMNNKEIKETMDEFQQTHSQLVIISENAACEENIDLDCCGGNHSHMICQLIETFIFNANVSSRYSSTRVQIDCEVNTIVDFLNNQDRRKIFNYIALSVFRHNLEYIGLSDLASRSRSEPDMAFKRREFCVSWIMNNMRWPLGYAYVSRYWPVEASNEINDMFHVIIQEMKNLILKQNWIENATKEDLSKELEATRYCLDHVINDMRNYSYINSLYKTFHPVRYSFMTNIFKFNKFLITSSTLHKEGMGQFVQKALLYLKPFSDYASTVDHVYLSFGILSSPFFHVGYPSLFNFAKIGGIIGHELGHKIDFFFEGITFEQFGKLECPDTEEYKPIINTNNQTLKQWKIKKSCLIDQYAKYELKGLEKSINSNFTVFDDIADNIALTLIEVASKTHLRGMKRERFALPGLSYSPEELLYISYAQTYCAVRTTESLQRFYDIDTHSPQEFRVRGVIENSRLFSQVFNCPSTSAMNSSNKCLVFNE